MTCVCRDRPLDCLVPCHFSGRSPTASSLSGQLILPRRHTQAISDVILARYALELLPGAAAFLPATAGTKVRATLVEAFIGTFSNVIGASADYDEVGALANLAEFLIIHSELGSLNAAFNMPEVSLQIAVNISVIWHLSAAACLHRLASATASRLRALDAKVRRSARNDVIFKP